MICKTRWIFCLATLGCLAWTSSLSADVALPPIFASGMVLQSELPVAVFGTADEGERVEVVLNLKSGEELQRVSTVATDGTWRVKLKPLEPGLKLKMTIKGKNEIPFRGILSGEVWLASGQSNMRMQLMKLGLTEEDYKRLDFPEIRYMFTPKSRWSPILPHRKRSGVLSALALYYGEELHNALDRPIGILDCSQNGAGAQQFISPAAFEADPELARMVEPHGMPVSDIFEKRLSRFAGFTIRGVLWCQGEANRDYPVTYRRLLDTLKKDWREHWQQPEMAFIIVQNANYQERRTDPWVGGDCAIREVQAKAADADPLAESVVTIDLGLENDVHYPNKKEVARRSALAARALVYGEEIVYSGPRFESVEFKDGRAIVTFSHIGGGLIAKDSDQLKGFLLLGPDKRMKRAEATIKGSTVIVSSPDVPNPVAVRYAWERNPDCNLYNREGLPASPFRSDDFESRYTRDARPK